MINLSLGHPAGELHDRPTLRGRRSGLKAGIVVVCAAGNKGGIRTSTTAGWTNEGWGTAYGSIESPGNDPYVITVGAMKNTDGRHRANDRSGPIPVAGLLVWIS